MFQSRIMFYMHLFVYKILTIVTDVELQVTFARHFRRAIGPLNKRKCFKLFSYANCDDISFVLHEVFTADIRV